MKMNTFDLSRALVPEAKGRLVWWQRLKPSKPKLEVTIHDIRSAFVAQGTSLNQWAKSNGYSPQHIQMAIRGKRNGPVAKGLLRAVLKAVRPASGTKGTASLRAAEVRPS